MCIEKTPWEQVIDFHGHTCPEIALGFRIAQIANRELGVRPTSDSELLGEISIQSCAIDALQVLNRCTVGRGALIIKDIGKHLYRFHYTGTETVLNISINSLVIQEVSFAQTILNPRLRQNKILEVIQNVLSIDEETFCNIYRENGFIKK